MTRIERYPGGAIYRYGMIRHGQLEGKEYEFDPFGGRRAVWHYRQGKKHGLQEGWFIEGPKRFVYQYVNGVLEGEQLEYHASGALFRRQVFRQGVEADRKVLYQEGDLHSNYAKRDGRTYGLDGGALCFDPKKEGEK
jgi:hypothetical protein